MTVPAKYPPAIQKMDGSGSGVWSGRGEWKLIVHTTETRGMPGYSNGAYAPHLTYWPLRRTWTQHSTLKRPAEAIRSYDDDQAYQIEAICYSSRTIANRVGGLWVGDLTDIHLADLAAFPNWLIDRGLPLQRVWPGRQALSYSEANADGFRYPVQAYLEWPGLLGHQHTPFPNTHWDPGAFPWPRFMALLRKDNMDHPYSSHTDFRKDHDIGEVPSWSPWDEYVAAGGSSLPESGTWGFTRADMAWVWHKFIRPLAEQNNDLRARVAELERDQAAGGGPTMDEIVTEIRRRLAE